MHVTYWLLGKLIHLPRPSLYPHGDNWGDFSEVKIPLQNLIPLWSDAFIRFPSENKRKVLFGLLQGLPQYHVAVSMVNFWPIAKWSAVFVIFTSWILPSIAHSHRPRLPRFKKKIQFYFTQKSPNRIHPTLRSTVLWTFTVKYAKICIVLNVCIKHQMDN